VLDCRLFSLRDSVRAHVISHWLAAIYRARLHTPNVTTFTSLPPTFVTYLPTSTSSTTNTNTSTYNNNLRLTSSNTRQSVCVRASCAPS
jgi:hypothetical protein